MKGSFQETFEAGVVRQGTSYPSSGGFGRGFRQHGPVRPLICLRYGFDLTQTRLAENGNFARTYLTLMQSLTGGELATNMCQ
jgi:hypothetical protein